MRKLRHTARAFLVLMLFLTGSLKVVGQSYCAATVASPGINWIAFFGTTLGISNISNTTLSTTYMDYSSSQIVSAVQGTSVNFSMNAHSGSSSCFLMIFVDWNQDGDFTDAGETVFNNTTGSGALTFSGSITVPMSALSGTTRMRVRSDWYGSTPTLSSPCGSSAYGEVEDYGFTVIAATPCSGTISAGAITAVDSICGGTSFGLTATGATLATGMVTQWQKRTSATAPWVNVGGAGTTLSETAGITATTYYRYYATCTSSGSTDTTDVDSVVVRPASQCYCIPTGGTGFYGCSTYRIDDVIVSGGVTNFSKLNSNCAGSSSFGNYTDSIATQYQGSSLSYSVKSEYSSTGTMVAQARIWVDWNQTGTFEASESVYSGPIVNGVPLVGTFDVPFTALLGDTRMRVMVASGATAISSACAFPGTYNYGEAEDYTIRVLSSPACNTVTATPITLSGPDEICSGTYPFTLTATGEAPASGVTRVWESRSPSGTGTWTVVTGATSSFLTVSGITAATDYRYTVTCTATGVATTSAVKTVTLAPFSECYCVPTGGTGFYGCTNYRIDSVKTTGGILNISKLNSNCAGSSAYADYSDSVVSQFQGGTVSYSIRPEYAFTGSYSAMARIWVDWNQNGTFETTESVYSGAITHTTPLIGTLEVPLTAVAGDTRMRIMVISGTTAPSSPCLYPGSYNYGETEDYTFRVLAATACSGAGTVGPVNISGPDSICAGTNPFTLIGSGPIASGITKVWERRPLGTTTWTAITGVTGSILNVTGITVATEFRYTVTCTASGNSASRIDTVGLKNPTDCYCTPSSGYGCLYNYNINNVSTSGATANISNLGTGCPAAAATGYSDYRHLFATAFQGTMVNYNIGLSSPNLGARMWIDWNRDGDFTDAGELIYESSTMSGSYAPTTITGAFEVPLTATPGATGMRISVWNTSSLSSTYTPCYSYAYVYGETEDYTFNIVQPPPCNTVPMAGVMIDGPDSVCASNAFVVTASSVPVASGVVRQWQSKPTSGTTWTTVAGATMLNYNVAAGITVPTDFRFIIACTATGASDTSDVISVTLKTPTNCYCDALFAQAYYDDLYTYNFRLRDVIIRGEFDTLKGLNTPWEYEGTSTADWGGYTDRTDESEVLGLPDLTQTGTYTGRITVRYTSASLRTRAWIDYNDNGFFEDSESIFTNPSSALMSSATPAEFSFTVPATAAPGSHRMRVRTVASSASPSVTGTNNVNPCTTYSTYGQTADFLVLVKRLMPCDSVAFPDSAISFATPPNVCGSGPVKLNLKTKMPLASGITYQWKSSATAAGPYTTNVGPALTALAGPAYTVPSVTSDIYYKCFVLCDGDPIVISDSVWVQSVSLPIALTTESGQTCGPGTVTLGGNTTDGSVFWYAEAAGGSPVWMGNEYITPYLTATDTFYATGGAFGLTEAVVGDGSSATTYSQMGPFSSYGAGKVMQFMYTADELAAAGVTAGNITKLAFDIAALPGYTLENYEISMKQVTTAPPMTWQTTGFSTVFTATTLAPITTGWYPFTLSGTGFNWDGTSNIIVKVCFNIPTLTSVYPPSSAGGTHRYNGRSGVSMGYMSYSLTSTTYCTSSGSANALRPNAQFTQLGCESARVPVIAYVRPVPAPVNIGVDETICKDIFGGRTLDVGTLPETYTRLWSDGSTNQTLRIEESGTYSIIVANEHGCEVYDTVTKVLLEIPDVDLGPDALLCEGGVLTLDAGDDGTDYIWSTGAATRFVDIYSAGTYNVLVENGNGCIAVDTIGVTVSGHMPSVGSIIVTNEGPSVFSFEALLPEYVIEYLWDFGDGNTSDEANPTHPYATPGSYTVTLTVKSTCGEMIYTTTAHILSNNNVNVEDELLILYPNPAKDIAVIENKGGLKMKSVTVTNVLGQEMYSGPTTSADKHELELSRYASGLYTVRIETNKGFVIRKFEIVK